MLQLYVIIVICILTMIRYIYVCIYYLVEVTEPPSLFFRTYVSSLFCLCSKISTLYILAFKSSSQNIMVLSTFKYTSSWVSEAQEGGRSAPITTELMMISAGPRARTPPAADTGGGVTADKAVRNILWKTKFGEGAFSLLNFWFYHTLLATGKQLGLFRKM